MSDSLRRVDFEACFNFRDLGGYPTADGRHIRWHTVYRSDTLHRLTAADAETFDALGVRTVIDLRSKTEIDDHGRLHVSSHAVAWHNLPMTDDLRLAPRDPANPAPPLERRGPGEIYLSIAAQFGTSIAGVFKLIATDDALPAVFHCTSGKDRTGVIAALLLDLLGVADEVIAADYLMTEEARLRSTAWIEANEPTFAAFLAQIPPERRAIRAETILAFLQRIRAKHGSTADFIGQLGVDEPQIKAVRDRLLDG